jgi:hypothetical protein
MQRRALLKDGRLKRRDRVERLVRVDNGAAMRPGGEVAEDEAEAVEEGRGVAEAIEGGEGHALADVDAVVEQVAWVGLRLATFVVVGIRCVRATALGTPVVPLLSCLSPTCPAVARTHLVNCRFATSCDRTEL